MMKLVLFPFKLVIVPVKTLLSFFGVLVMAVALTMLSFFVMGIMWPHFSEPTSWGGISTARFIGFGVFVLSIWAAYDD